MGDKRTPARHVIDGGGRLSTACRRFVAKIPFVHVEEKKAEGASLNLCRRCKRIDLGRIFNGPSPSTGSETVLSLGTLDKESPCALCRFFYSVRRPSLTGQTADLYHLRKYCFNHVSWDIKHGRGILWGVDPGPGLEPWTRRLDFNSISHTMTDSLPLLFLPQSTKPCPYPEEILKGLPVNETSVNYPLLCNWIKECEGHPNCSYLSSDLTKSHTGPTIRGIDCETRLMVDLQPGNQYIALSYVWGNKPLVENKGSRVLPTNAPKVIEDAMVVVKELGQQYLWVDQYCINQHDEQDKHAQIKNMDHIYEGSQATIVAFSGVDSSSGLPGVSSTPRIPQPRFTSSKVTLLGFTPSITRQSFDASVWIKRGWTFQEALLSRRLLIFTREQVHFQCSFGWWVESSTPIPRMLHEFGTGRHGLGNNIIPRANIEAMESISPLIRLPSQKSGQAVQVKFERLVELIQRFTRRQLSFQLDALDAVRGLLSRVGVLTYWGIPVYNLPQGYRDGFAFHALKANALFLRLFFLQCLLWIPRRRRAVAGAEYLGRRKGFPSWSWLGWMMPSGFQFRQFPNNSSNSYKEVPNVKIEDGSGALLSLFDLIESSRTEMERSRVLPERTTYLWLEGLVLTLGFHLKSSQNGNSFWLHFCFDHPLGYSDHPCEMKESGAGSKSRCNKYYGTVWFRMDFEGSKEMAEEALKRKWDCLLTFSGKYDYGTTRTYQFLILDEGEDAAYCVGTFLFEENTKDGDLFDKLKTQVPCSSRKVRLG